MERCICLIPVWFTNDELKLLTDYYYFEYFTGNNRVRLVSSVGIITTAVGTGLSSYNGENVAPTSANLNNPVGLSQDSDSGYFLISETNGNRIRQVKFSSPSVVTYAGTGSSSSNAYDSNGDSGPATSCTFNFPYGIFADSDAKLYVADEQDYKIRAIYSVQLTEQPTAVPTEMPSDAPTSNVAVITLVAGTGSSSSTGTDGPATSAGLQLPIAVWKSTLGEIYIAEYGAMCVRKIDIVGIVESFLSDCSGTAGSNLGDGGPATSASVNLIYAVAGDSVGRVYVSDPYNFRVRMVDATGTVSTIIGDGTPSDSDVGGPATSSEITYPQQVWVNSAGEVYVSALLNKAIRRISADGYLYSYAGRPFVMYYTVVVIDYVCLRNGK